LAAVLLGYFREWQNLQAECKCEAKEGIFQQAFLEKEPEILVIHLVRNVHHPAKITTPVAFPEELLVLRSGTYRFAAVVEHISQKKSVAAGHYTSTIWLGGDRYAVYDDGREVRLVTWSHLETSLVRVRAYLLVYVRLTDGGCHRRDGSELTPYSRDESSMLLSRESMHSASVASVDTDRALMTPSEKGRPASQGSGIKRRKLGPPVIVEAEPCSSSVCVSSKPSAGDGAPAVFTPRRSLRIATRAALRRV
jgi:hypothetical protein